MFNKFRRLFSIPKKEEVLIVLNVNGEKREFLQTVKVNGQNNQIDEENLDKLLENLVCQLAWEVGSVNIDVLGVYRKES